jgi:hypothetical protein
MRFFSRVTGRGAIIAAALSLAACSSGSQSANPPLSPGNAQGAVAAAPPGFLCVQSVATFRPPSGLPKLKSGALSKAALPDAVTASSVEAPDLCGGNLVPAMMNESVKVFPKGMPPLEPANSGETLRPMAATVNACDGFPGPSPTDCFYYASARFDQLADGAGMTQMIASPHYDNSGGFGHSLSEVSVGGVGPTASDYVELGWSVSSNQFGDLDPHLFIFDWINGVPTCYYPCSGNAWHQYSKKYFPGMDLRSMVGTSVYIGYVHYKGAWWAWFKDGWVGYIPDTQWGGAFTKGSALQWFGEVDSANGIPPKTAMGDGLFPANPAAATMSTLCDVNAASMTCTYRDKQSIWATVPAYYDISHTGFGAVRYGGSGL